MTPEEFVKGFHLQKQQILDLYTNDKDLHASCLINELDLDNRKKDLLKKIFDQILTDAYYSILLGIDGEASIGNAQHAYKLFNEAGKELTGSGEIEAEAWEYFHNDKQ